MAGRLLPLYGRTERKRTSLFGVWCLTPGRWRKAATLAIALLTLFGVLLLYASPSSLSQSTPSPVFLVQQQQTRHQDLDGGASRDLAAFSSAANSARQPAVVLESRVSDNSEELVEVDSMGRGYGARRRSGPLVLPDDEADEDLHVSVAEEEVDEKEASINGPARAETQGGRQEGTHSEPESNMPADSSRRGPTVDTRPNVAAVDERDPPLSEGQQTRPELERGSVSRRGPLPSPGKEQHSNSVPVEEEEEEGRAVAESKLAMDGRNLKEGGSAGEEREGEGQSGDNKQTFTGADVEKQSYVKNMMEHAWSNYVQFAWGKDELDPRSKRGKSSGIFGNSEMGATIVDSLDTLLVMGMKEEFARAKEWVEKKLDFSQPMSAVSLFEFNIRFLGGLLSAYAFTKDEVFKAKAVDLADRLIPTFNTSTGLPCGSVVLNLSKTDKWKPCTSSIPLAELGSLHLEWLYLTAITKDTKYYKKVKHVRDLMQSLQKSNKGLFYTMVSVSQGQFVSKQVTIGAPADSFYEYLIKSWVMTRRRDVQAADMYFKVMEAFEATLLQTSADGLQYFAEMGSNLLHHMGHLACFAGGMLALTSLNTDGDKQEHFLSLAENITATCHESYHRTDTHIGPEVMVFSPGGTMATADNPMYILRPETVESYFYMWRATHDPKYREWGWEAVQAIDKHCRTDSGYAGIRNVYRVPAENDNTQQSFFLAETLKYLYLLFSDDSLIPLDQWVFNTEAHPLPVLEDVPVLNT